MTALMVPEATAKEADRRAKEIFDREGRMADLFHEPEIGE